jgi:hypothetical protein
MPDNVFVIIKDIGIFTIGAFFIQKIIERSASKSIEAYKSQLGLELERFKNEMNFQFKRQSVLHEKRLNIIDETYKKIVALDSAMRSMTSAHVVREDAEKEHKQRVETAFAAFDEYNKFYSLNKLYFSKHVESLLARISKEYYSAYYDFFTPDRLRAFTGGNPSAHGYEIALEKAQSAINHIQKEIPMILDEVASEFRQILGVEVSEARG